MGKNTSVSHASSDACCSMAGVRCVGSKVVTIVWMNKGLNGSIPVEIANLKSLRLL